MDPRDFIDQDEGYRDTDWDSHLDPREAFFTHALPCESCGRPYDESDLKRADWDENLMVGPCCAFSFDIPELENVPTCPTLWNDLEHCKSVEQVAMAMEAHVLSCQVCGEKRKEALEMPLQRGEERKAA